MISAQHLRMARAGLGWTLIDLSERSGVNPNTISRYEQGQEGLVSKWRKLEAALQAAGDDSGIDYSDIPKLTEEQLARMVRLRDVRRKVPVSVRLDPQVLDWLRAKGDGHLTRINDILTRLMEAEKRTDAG